MNTKESALYRISCGAVRDYRDRNGDLWSADQPYDEASGWGNAGAHYVHREGLRVCGTEEEPLYQTEAYGQMTYRFRLENGAYRVTLHFAEMWAAAAQNEKRLFNVWIGETRVLSRFDPGREAGGPRTALLKTFTDIRIHGGEMSLRFEALKGMAMINGIEIFRDPTTGCGVGAEKQKTGIGQTIKEIETPRILADSGDSAWMTRILKESSEVLTNPGKGWIVYYYDQGVGEEYGGRLQQDDLADFPGFTGVYFRLAWSFLEPEEGIYNWDVLDRPMKRWIEQGKDISFRITCCESDPAYATPKWVQEAGAKGTFFDTKSWEPDYGDPVFLSKLENFVKVFAERYDNRPGVSSVDIGSCGIWGEWHTTASTNLLYPIEALKKHIGIYRKHFKNVQLFINYGAGPELCEYARQQGIGLRTDSGCGYFVNPAPASYEALFARAALTAPTLIETYHYRKIKDTAWQNGSTLTREVEQLHASWVGVHHYPREWLEENRDLAVRLGNRMGYWFILHCAVYPQNVQAGEEFQIQLNWENRGVAPIYRNYPVALSLIRIVDGAEGFRGAHPAVDIRRWNPGRVTQTYLAWNLPKDLAPGSYRVRIGLVESLGDPTAKIKLGIEGREPDLFYPIGTVNIQEGSRLSRPFSL
ncbi:MAG: malectin domain-containing carbohydrate-binding protein [Kiritimatiellia bacterium]|nr:malectin domain-containing carbohydrate-binding protein [Kiritimatiellia bacterium]